MKMELLTKDSFTILVQEMMASKSISYIDAIVEICRARALDLEVVPELLNPKLKKLIRDEATELHMVKKTKKRRKNVKTSCTEQEE